MGRINSQLKRLLPEFAINGLRPAQQRLLYLKYGWDLYRLHVSKKRLLILATIPKSGRTYASFLVTNYLRLASGTARSPLSYTEMGSMVPNTWDRAYWGEAPLDRQMPTPSLSLLGLDDFVVTHMPYRSPYWDQSRVLHLYRNPLDYAVSFYFNAFDPRWNQSQSVSGPVEILDRYLEEYAQLYLSFRDVARAGNTNVLRLSYEDLVTNPEACLTVILRWHGVDAEPSLVQAAARFSSKESIRQLEKHANVFPLTRPRHGHGSHIRDGSIGQWKEYFDSSDVSRVRKRLNTFGIKLDEFTLET